MIGPLTAIALMLSGPAKTMGAERDRASDPQIFLFGVGLQSCATAESRPSEMAGWVGGFVSARNFYDGLTVGRSTDPAGFIAEVHLVCAAEPSLLLMTAVNRVYETMKRLGK